MDRTNIMHKLPYTMNSYGYEKLVANIPHAMIKLVDRQHIMNYVLRIVVKYEMLHVHWIDVRNNCII